MRDALWSRTSGRTEVDVITIQNPTHETADVQQDGRRIFITLCRPEIHNAQSSAFMRDLLAITESLKNRDDFDAVVIRSSSDHWCTGLDMKEAAERGGPDPNSAEIWDTMLTNLRSLDQIVVGLIDGYCLGGGIQLAVGCDIRVATDRAIFAIPAAREVGILGGLTTWYLPRLLGVGRAKAILLGGAVLNAEQAAQWGLIDQVVPVDDLASAWEKIVAPLSADSWASVAACKHTIETAHDLDVHTAFAEYLRTQERLTALPAAANMAQAVIDQLAAGKRPYLEVGWFPFGEPE
ncbi:enoyl-CoA hydratase/isomerase family protein [Mycobacterium sp. 134]|uniref:enoyl-CoA hydratase/isomerase family protein n=1 Tax=Mycobacterium sp. 134 TaxID=3400425 RepID=UPI003AACCB6B